MFRCRNAFQDRAFRHHSQPNTQISRLKTENLVTTAFAPANISLIFETYPATATHGRGSLGVGITLEQGVVAEVRHASEQHPAGIYVHGEKWAFPTVAKILDSLSTVPLHVELTAAFPFGCGFGMSGASALATAYAVDSLLHLNLPREKIGMAAHLAEVAAATGLGDVGGQFNGGVMIKTVKYEPLHVHQLPVTADQLHVRIHGPIHTADVIGSEEKLRAINAAGHAALAKLSALGKALTLDQLMDVSHDFATGSGLLVHPELIATINEIKRNGGHASMIMLGEAIVSTVPFQGSQPVTVTTSGGRLLD